MTPSLPPDLAAAVKLGGEMGRLFGEFDWEAHPLGPPQGWPEEIRSAVTVVLTSRFPIVLWLGAEDLFLVYNDAYIQILGEKHPEALGRRGRYVWWDIWEPINPMLAGVIATGEATWSYDLMLPMVTAGRRQERYFTFTYSPLVGGDGAIYGIFCPSFETTQRVLSERRLHALNAIASATMETHSIDAAVNAAIAACAGQPDIPLVAAYVGDGQDGGGAGEIALRGATPAVMSLLPRTLAGLTDWDPTERSRTDAQLIEDVVSVLPDLEDALEGDCPDQLLVLPLGEGSAAGALVIGLNPRRPLDEQYRGFCQLLTDQLSSAIASAISYDQQRQRADALTELDHAKTAFLTNVSHEFRTPLTLLTGPLDDALAEAGSDALLTHRLSTARRNAGRLLRLVDSLLDFSRLEAGRATADFVCTDVGALTSHIASSFTELCQRAELDLVLDCQPVLADIDPTMWETIMLNLLSNAVKYTLAGSITVLAHSDGTQCRIAVRDTGVGISEDDLKQVGERFFRAQSTRGRSVEGTGIGLSLVRGLVELQRGTMQIDSELDRGTTVTIRLPRSVSGTPVDVPTIGLLDNPYVVEADQWVASPASADIAADDGRELVLIVEDNADMRAHLERVLSVRWRTALAGDGEAALQMTRELRPDIVVTDVMMPRLDGFQFIAAVRAYPELAATPIVMLSARAGAEAVSEGYSGGADDYLPKPFRSQDLIDRVGARLAAAARQRASLQSSDAQARLALDFTRLEAALQAADSVTAIVAALQDSPVGSGNATVISLGVLDSEGKRVRFEYAGPVPAEMRDRYYVASMDTPLVPVDVIKTGEPMIITDTLSLTDRYQHVVQETAGDVRSCVSQPLRGIDGRVIGSLGLLWPTPQEFDSAQLEMFARTAIITQSAVDRIRNVQRDHRIAIDFQEHLLDLDRRSTAAVVAAVYQPAGEAMRVGGDWYLVVPLERPGEVAISVGDVVGHGLPAAIVMSRLRAAVAATANSDSHPTAVLGALDRYAATVEGARCATVSYAVLQTNSSDEAGSISYACAGHPYPLLVAPGEAPVFLESGRRPPIAAWQDQVNHDAGTTELPPGSLVLLYTDGLIERPGETLDQGFTRLEGAAAYRADLPVGEICAELLERMAPPDGYTDDVVVLAIRPCHSSAHSYAAVLPATLNHLAQARHGLRDWLVGIAADSGRQADVLLATGEAVTNAVEHGSRGDPGGTVSIEAFLRGETVAVTVSDAGEWSRDSSASQRSKQRGRGLTLMNGLADDVTTVRTAQGTRVTLRFDHVVTSDARLVTR